MGARDARGPTRRPATVAAVLLGVCLAACAPTTPSGAPSTSLPAVIPTGSAAAIVPTPAATSAGPGPSATPDPQAAWARVDLPPIEPPATLEPTRPGPAGLPMDGSLTLTSRTAVSGLELARGLEVAPAAELVTTPGGTDATALIRPATAFDPGTTYRFTLHAPDGTLAGSWAFTTESPPTVAGTLPRDGTTAVPLDTGIEVTFDQDGVGDVAPFFSIAPKTAGHFERHGRTAVFVPDELKPKTVYTVTIRRGVPLEGSDLTLVDDLRFSFETGLKPGAPEADEWVDMGGLVEAAVGARPIIELSTSQSRVPVRVYRLPGLSAATAAWLQLQNAPDWAVESDVGLVPTKGLAEVARFTAKVRSLGEYSSTHWIQFPAALPAGWYLVTVPRSGRDGQAVLQVTDVATVTLIGSGRLIVWANDLASDATLPGATVSTGAGTSLGTTDADGLLETQAPAIRPAPAFDEPPASGAIPRRDERDLLIVRAAGAHDRPGRVAFVPLARTEETGSEADAWWRFLATDRSLFRSTDRIEAWGIAARRAGAGTDDIRVRLVPGEGYEDVGAPVAEAAVRPDARTGVFAVEIPFADLPAGPYVVELRAGDVVLAQTLVRVGVIRKPAYTLTVDLDRAVAVAGDRVTATVTARFFDGTAAPGIRLAVGWGGANDPKATTGADGSARVVVPVTWGSSDTWSQWAHHTVTARPVDPEEGSIEGSARLLVFASHVVLDADVMTKNGRSTLVGSLHAVDLERLEREERAGRLGELDPAGDPVAGAAVAAAREDGWTEWVRSGTVYDFIAKKSVPTYNGEYRSKRLPPRTLRTDGQGRFSMSIGTVPAGHQFRYTLSAADVHGHGTSLEEWADPSRPSRASTPTVPLTVSLDRSDRDLYPGGGGYGVGDTIVATLERGTPLPSGGSNRYLFWTARAGWLDARVSSTPILKTTFRAADIPALSIGGALFNGSSTATTTVDWGCGGSSASAVAPLDTRTKTISVSVSVDRARYRPGQTVKLDVRTTDGSGRPAPASVVLRAIDEKLYAADAASTADVLGDLFWWTPWQDGVSQVGGSHGLPQYGPEGVSTCGPGPFGRDDVTTRSDLRDTLLFRRLTTDADGRASVSFPLSDDLTSWRVSAVAVTADLDVGEASIGVPVGLPVFIEAPVAPTYIAGDRPTIRLRAYGDGLAAGQPVIFTVSAPSLGLDGTRVTGRAFATAEVALPTLTAGDHEVTVGVLAGAAGSDRLLRTIHVVPTRLTQRQTVVADLAAGPPRPDATGLVSYVFSDLGRASFVPALEDLAEPGGVRIDQVLAAGIARRLLVGAFGADPARFTAMTADPEQYLVSSEGPNDWAGRGLALLPYASPDLALTARAALLARDQLDADLVRRYLENPYDYERDTTREEDNLALAGLAGLGDPVLAEIVEALAEPDLTTRERLYLALGAAALGDHATALAVERAELARVGERLGPWVRLRVGTTLDDTIEATALVALIGATVGDAMAEAAEAYVESNPAADDIFELQRAAYIERALARAPETAARVAYAVDGVERTADVGPYDRLSLTITPAQARAFTARAVSGRVGVAVSWDERLDPAGVVADPALRITRTVEGGYDRRADAPVVVTLTAAFGGQAVDDWYVAVDHLPSGLAPLFGDGQDVSVILTRRDPTASYRARVVMPGSYVWEPATLQSLAAPGPAALTPTERLTLR